MSQKFINQIDDRLIAAVLSDEEIKQHKEVAKKYKEIKDEKEELERALHSKLKGMMVGNLKGIELNYLVYGDNFYVSYKEE